METVLRDGRHTLELKEEEAGRRDAAGPSGERRRTFDAAAPLKT